MEGHDRADGELPRPAWPALPLRPPRRPLRVRCRPPRHACFDFAHVVVYTMHMARTNIDIDDEACTEVMRRYRIATKREAVNVAWRGVAAGPLGRDEARSLRGSGWDGDLDEMRSGRAG